MRLSYSRANRRAEPGSSKRVCQERGILAALFLAVLESARLIAQYEVLGARAGAI